MKSEQGENNQFHKLSDLKAVIHMMQGSETKSKPVLTIQQARKRLDSYN